MFDYSKEPCHSVICVDSRSFYASAHCILLGLDPLQAKLAVVGDISRTGSVVLASSVELKKLGIKTGSRHYEAIKLQERDKSIIIVQARMAHYLQVSAQIRQIFLDFVPPNALHVYSCDEAWLTLSGTEKLHGNAWEASQKIIDAIMQKTGIPSGIGIGPNKFLAKFALDAYGKKAGIAEIRYEDVAAKVHPQPLREMWGIGEQMEKHFRQMGMRAIGDLARFPREPIEKKFGKNGAKLWEQAWGIDRSAVFYSEQNPAQSVFGFESGAGFASKAKGIGRGVVLMRDYTDYDEIALVIRELSDEVCEQLRTKNLAAKTVSLAANYNYKSNQKGFSRQISYKTTRTADLEDIYSSCLLLLNKHHKDGSPVRELRVSVSGLAEEARDAEPPDERRSNRRKLWDAVDAINGHYGKGTVRRASSLLDASVARGRAQKVAGHYA